MDSLLNGVMDSLLLVNLAIVGAGMFTSDPIMELFHVQSSGSIAAGDFGHGSDAGSPFLFYLNDSSAYSHTQLWRVPGGLLGATMC